MLYKKKHQFKTSRKTDAYIIKYPELAIESRSKILT